MSTLIISEESRVKAANWCVERPRDHLVAKEFGLRDSVPRRWIDKLRREMASADEAPELPRLRQENERLRARHFRSWNTNMSSLHRGQRDSHPVRLTCTMLEVSAAGYYA
jgi:transposase